MNVTIFDRNKLGGRFTVQGIAVRDVKPDTIVLDIRGPAGSPRPSEFFTPEVARKLAFDILEATGSFYCRGCGRAEDDCSADPCERVKADREA